MSAIFRKSVALVLVALLAVISGVGEGLHSIPGCGHGIEVGNRILLLGIDVPDRPQPDDGRSCVGLPHGPQIPVYTEDQCAICSAVSHNCALTNAPPAILALHLVQALPLLVVADVLESSALSFQARAPPLA